MIATIALMDLESKTDDGRDRTWLLDGRACACRLVSVPGLAGPPALRATDACLSRRPILAIVVGIVHGKVGGRGGSEDRGGAHAVPSSAVGKRTQVEGCFTSQPHVDRVIQRKGDAGAPLDGVAAANIARRGTEGAGGQLPHHDRIRSLFGRHDISGVTAHEGPAASEASDALGARAYAHGNAVAFGSWPDLHTAAHEAAHVVQQRGGVQLKGGIDQPGDVYERHADAVADAVVAGKSAAPLLDRFAGGGQHDAAVQRAPAAAGDADGASVTPPAPGIDQAGFIDRKDGANLHTDPVRSADRLVRDQPLPPATRVFVSGTHPHGQDWWYVTAFLPGTMVRGYVQGFRVNTHLPEPLAELHMVADGETAEALAKKQFSSAVSDGHDLRYYENVLLRVNQSSHRPGVRGSYQDPGVLGGGSNNVQLVAGELIWLVSAPYAKSLQNEVPSGSLTGGAVAKVKRFVGHIEDILHSVTESRNHFGEVAGEYAQAIRDHLPEIAGIVAAFIMAEATSAFLAATPTGVGQTAAVVIQLALAAFGAAGMVQAGMQAVAHASEWLTIAWTANGKVENIAAASKEFLKMLVSVAIAALSYAGVKGNLGNAVKIANAMPTGGLPALAVSGGGQLGGGAGAGTGVLIGPGTGSIGAAGNAMMQADKDGHGDSTPEASGPKLPEGLDKRLIKVIKDVIQRARAGKLLKAGNYHPHFDDGTVLEIIRDAEAIYQSEGKAGRLIFRKGSDIVVVEGPGSAQGNVVTGYGPRGIKGDSGAAALGGAAGEGGAPVTDAMITSGTIPVPKGRPPIPKAVQIAP